MTVHDIAPRPRAAVICHPERLVAEAVAAVLVRRDVVRSAVTALSWGRLLAELREGPDVAVVFDCFDEDIGELFEAIRHRSIVAPVVIVGGIADADRAAELLEWGAAGLVLPSCTPEVLCRSVLQAGTGAATVPEEMRGPVLEALRARRLRRHDARHVLAQLTRTDVTVLRDISDGMTVAQIAVKMSLSPHTIRSHVRELGESLGVRGQLRVAATGRALLGTARRAVWEADPLAGGEAGA